MYESTNLLGERRYIMSFYQEMRQCVLCHGAINNVYLSRFQRGDLTDEEFHQFAVEFYNFARFFPKILVAQLVNTEDERVANELTNVLYSELGNGHTRRRHELLYRDFLRRRHGRARGNDAPDAPFNKILHRGHGTALQQWKPRHRTRGVLWTGEYGHPHVGLFNSRIDPSASDPLSRYGHDLFHIPPGARVWS